MTMHIKELNTPCFLVDLDKVKDNCQKMIARCKELGVTLRPHMKTHKTLEGGELQTNGTKRCIAVSTLAEAEFYADGGFDDILLAYPVTEEKITRCVALLNRLSIFHVMVSDNDGVKCLENHYKDLPKGKVWSVVLELDTGYGRTGFPWDTEDILQAAKSLQSSGHVKLEKLYIHCGNSYSMKSVQEREELQKTNIQRLQQVERKLSIIGITINSGVGSTPTCSVPIKENCNFTEFHPGCYIFYDYEQYLLNSCREANVACRVMTRVIAHKKEKNMILVDCGFAALSHDGMRQRLPNLDYCLIQGESNLRMIGMTQEIGKIMAREGDLDCRNYPVGTILYIIPYHSCVTAMLHSFYYIHSGEKVVSKWIPNRGW